MRSRVVLAAWLADVQSGGGSAKGHSGHSMSVATHPAPRTEQPRPAESRINSVAYSVGNISQFAPSHFAELEMKKQQEAAKATPPLQSKVPPKSCMAKPGGPDKNPAIYKLPDELPEHLTIHVRCCSCCS